VRLRDFAEAFMVGGDRNLYSVCQSDYSTALEAIAEAIADQVKPACMTECVADSDGDPANGLTPFCTLEELVPTDEGVDRRNVPKCNVDTNAGTWDFPNDNTHVCFIELTQNDTPSEIDDISTDCSDEGFNLEFRLERREGHPAPGGTTVTATCELSGNPSVDCPDL
jgi:hypothetical protein